MLAMRKLTYAQPTRTCWPCDRLFGRRIRLQIRGSVATPIIDRTRAFTAYNAGSFDTCGAKLDELAAFRRVAAEERDGVTRARERRRRSNGKHHPPPAAEGTKSTSRHCGSTGASCEA